MAQDDIARLVAVLEADIKGFTKGMEKAQAEFDKRANAIERSQTSMMRRLNAGFGALDPSSLIRRFLSWGTVITATQRLVRESIEVNDQAAASWSRLEETLSKLAFTVGPVVADFFDGLSDIIKRDIDDLEKLVALWEKIKNFGNGTTSIPMGVSPLQPGYNATATFNKSTGTWTPQPGGFPVSGVTDVTPKKPDADPFARMYNESMINLADQLMGQFRKRWEADAEELRNLDLDSRRKRGENAVSPLTGLTQADMDALDEFHADAKAAWDRYYEGIADAADKAAELERERVADRIAEIGDAFEYLGQAALRGGDVFKRALADMAASLAMSGLRHLFENLLTNLVGSGGFLGNVIAARAAGGPVSGNSPYLVGEKGPELFVPKTSGTIIPNASSPAMGGGSTVLNMPIDARGAQQGVAEQLARVAPAIVEAAFRRVNKNLPQMMIRAQRDAL